MNISAYAPSEPLRPFIKTYLIIECPDERVNRVLPDTSIVMAFRYKGQVSYVSDDFKNNLSACMVSGLRKSGRLINYSKDTGNILVIFKETGANAFIKEPLYKLFGESIPLDYCAGYHDVSATEEQLAAATSHIQRISLIEQFLLSKLNGYRPDSLIEDALIKMHAIKGALRIRDLAGSLYISQDAFEKRFRKIIGVSPKQFCYIIRMRDILDKGLKKQTLTGTAFDAGYFDQAHFTKDFKLFTGQTPTDFLKSPALW